MRTRFFVVALVLVALPVFAQSPTSYEMRIYLGTAAIPQLTVPIPVSSVTCNLVAPAITSTVNPTAVLWTDPVNTGRVCQVRFDAIQGPIAGLANGSYEGSVVQLYPEGPGPESARVPFSRARLPGAVTGLRFTR